MVDLLAQEVWISYKPSHGWVRASHIGSNTGVLWGSSESIDNGLNLSDCDSSGLRGGQDWEF